MAGDYIACFLLVLFLKDTEMINFNVKLPDEDKKITMRSHLEFESVSKYCLNRNNVCKSNNTNVCGLKMVNQKRFYKDFTNTCFLFFSNMCDHPESEYFIVSGGSCEEYLANRRSDDSETKAPNDYQIRNLTNSSETVSDSDNNTVKDADGLRSDTMSTLYSIDQSFDDHNCPYSCPNVYSPVCVNVNRGLGKYFKMLTFINHCSADIYYCKHWEEFQPPPDEYELVRDSPLSMSYCGSSRYIQFARFAETTSSMGHYGWLKGDYKYNHILTPNERLPGYG